MKDPPRLGSLDALRGFAIASMVLVNNPGDWGNIYGPLGHAKWNGWTFTDIVFPLFLFTAGVAMTLSLGRRSREGASRRELLLGAWRRAAVISLVGLALNFIPAFDPATVRIPGVLQRIALCVAIAAPVVILGGWRASVISIVLLCAAYSVPMLAYGRLEPGEDFGAAVDRAVFGSHLWSQSKTWDPEGLVSTLPAAASLLFGVLAGYYVVRDPDRNPAPAMAVAGAAFLVVGLAMDAAFMPINKNLWTPSYAVFMTGWSLIGFALFHALHDRLRSLFLPLTIFGMNALFIFAFSGLVARLIDKPLLYGWVSSLPLAPKNASLAYAIVFELAMFSVAWFMWKKRWFVKA